MKAFRRQFGPAFADALSKCPTLVADLAEIRAKGVKIRKVGGHCQAYSMLTRMTIYIGSKCKLSYALIALAHEKVHLLVSPTPNPTPGVSSRQAFIKMCLEAETDSIVHEVQVVQELLDAGVKVDAHSMKWYRRFKKGGRAAIREAMNEAITSNTGEKYPDYYGGWYDEVVKPKDRLPFRQLIAGGSDIPSLEMRTTPRTAGGEASSLDVSDIDVAELVRQAVSSAGLPGVDRCRCPRFAPAQKREIASRALRIRLR